MNQDQIYKKQTGGAIPHIYKRDLETMEILLPPINVQKEIVNFLDPLFTYTNDIVLGLPAEIAAREQQYNYYLNKIFDSENIDNKEVE